MGFMFTVFLEKENNFDKSMQNSAMVNCISIPHVITKRVVVIRVFPWHDYQFHLILFNKHSLNSGTLTRFNFPKVILSMHRIEVVINFSKGFVKAFTVEKLCSRMITQNMIVAVVFIMLFLLKYWISPTDVSKYWVEIGTCWAECQIFLNWEINITRFVAFANNDLVRL